MNKKWELITEVKENGYYIGWSRSHTKIHIPEPMRPMSKSSIVQIGGSDEHYVVRGITFAHDIFPTEKYSTGKPGIRLFDKSYHFKTLSEAQSKADEIGKFLIQEFDKVSRTDEQGNLL